jgi:hypothetical protein
MHSAKIDPANLGDLLELTRDYIKKGTIGNPETPAILRQIARDHLRRDLPIKAQADLIPWAPAVNRDALVLWEVEIRPGVRSLGLTVPSENDMLRVRIGAFERACHRNVVRFMRMLRRLTGKASAPARPAVRTEPLGVLIARPSPSP